jgi:hypothetical protein
MCKVCTFRGIARQRITYNGRTTPLQQHGMTKAALMILTQGKFVRYITSIPLGTSDTNRVPRLVYTAPMHQSYE